MVKSFAKPFKRQGDPYAPGLRSTVLSTQQSEAAAAGVVAGEGELYQQLT